MKSKQFSKIHKSDWFMILATNADGSNPVEFPLDGRGRLKNKFAKQKPRNLQAAIENYNLIQNSSSSDSDSILSIIPNQTQHTGSFDYHEQVSNTNPPLNLNSTPISTSLAESSNAKKYDSNPSSLTETNDINNNQIIVDDDLFSIMSYNSNNQDECNEYIFEETELLWEEYEIE
ncbi:hypothetical protein M9Y10_017420 [Tritrichomonas musculus]|uniref:Uncharacterized protein n=1 Tax=Tritrichomonas musculus TaxID=1915356 RepID=A0ABR2HV58_9EUKA